MANTILRKPTAGYQYDGFGAGGPRSGLITLQDSMSVSMATTAAGQYNFGWRVPAFCDGGKIYRLGFLVWRNGNTLTEDWSDGTGDLKITTILASKWSVATNTLTTITSKGDWFSTSGASTAVVSFTGMSPAIGLVPNAADGFAYYEVNRENASSLFSVSSVNAGDLIRLWVTLTNGTGGTIVPFMTGFCEIDQTAV